MIERVYADVRQAGVRSPVGVTVRVWGWDDATMDHEFELLEHVRAIVAESYYFGLETADIEEDVIQNTFNRFENADLTMAETGEFDLTLMPTGIE